MFGTLRASNAGRGRKPALRKVFTLFSMGTKIWYPLKRLIRNVNWSCRSAVSVAKSGRKWNVLPRIIVLPIFPDVFEVGTSAPSRALFLPGACFIISKMTLLQIMGLFETFYFWWVRMRTSWWCGVVAVVSRQWKWCGRCHDFSRCRRWKMYLCCSKFWAGLLVSRTEALWFTVVLFERRIKCAKGLNIFLRLESTRANRSVVRKWQRLLDAVQSI